MHFSGQNSSIFDNEYYVTVPGMVPGKGRALLPRQIYNGPFQDDFLTGLLYCSAQALFHTANNSRKQNEEEQTNHARTMHRHCCAQLQIEGLARKGQKR